MSFYILTHTLLDPENPIIEPPSPPQRNCLEGYTPYHYGCYRLLSNTQKPWEEMRDECRSHSTGTIKSDLASIHSEAEDATLHIKVMQSGGRAWIGFKESHEVNVPVTTVWLQFPASLARQWSCLLVWGMALQWRHNGRDSVSNHQPHDCLLNRLFRRRSKLRVTGLCAGDSPVTGEFPAQWPVTRKMIPFNDIIMYTGIRGQL